MRIRDHILGPDYDLSFAFITSAESQALNLQYRGKDKPTNILSFPLTATGGEIVIDRDLARREARTPERDEQEYFTYLFIHGLLHLNGMDHGSRMERKERQLSKLFLSTHDQDHHRRTRYRHRRRPAGGLRSRRR